MSLAYYSFEWHNDIQHKDLINDIQHTLSIMTLSIMTLSIMTLSITTLSITTLSITALSIMTLPLFWMPLCWVLQFIYCYADCHYAECRYAKCRGVLRNRMCCSIKLILLIKRFFKLFAKLAISKISQEF